MLRCELEKRVSKLGSVAKNRYRRLRANRYFAFVLFIHNATTSVRYRQSTENPAGELRLPSVVSLSIILCVSCELLTRRVLAPFVGTGTLYTVSLQYESLTDVINCLTDLAIQLYCVASRTLVIHRYRPERVVDINNDPTYCRFIQTT